MNDLHYQNWKAMVRCAERSDGRYHQPYFCRHTALHPWPILQSDIRWSEVLEQETVVNAEEGGIWRWAAFV